MPHFAGTESQGLVIQERLFGYSRRNSVAVARNGGSPYRSVPVLSDYADSSAVKLSCLAGHQAIVVR